MELDENIAFGLSQDRAAELTIALGCEIAIRSNEGLSPTTFISEVASRYEGKERDFVIYTGGRIYADYHASLEPVRPALVLFLMDKAENEGHQTIESLVAAVSGDFEKGERLHMADKIISKIKDNED